LSMKEEGLYLDAVSRIHFVERTLWDSGFQELKVLLMEDKIFRKQLRQRKRAYEQELRLQQIYLGALSEYVYATELRPDTVHTLRWWEGEIAVLKNWKNSRDVEASRLADRLLYLLEVHFDEDIRSYQKSKQWDKTIFMADLWMMIPPDQSWSRWNVASVYARAGDKEKAIGLIKIMVQTGEARYDWFRDAVDFESLANEPEYISLMKILRERDSQ